MELRDLQNAGRLNFEGEMIKYQLWLQFQRIDRVEVTTETTHLVQYSGEGRDILDSKKNDYYIWFDGWQEAKDHLITTKTQECIAMRQCLEKEEKTLESLLKMEEPS